MPSPALGPARLGVAGVRALALTQAAAAREAAVKALVAEAGDYDVKLSLAVLFAAKRSWLSRQSKRDLRTIGAQAAGIKDYVVTVEVYSDDSGDAHADLKLSDKRASRVIEFMVHQCDVKPDRLLVLGAVAASHAKAEGNPATDEAEKHGVIVAVLASKDP
jgi:outer membrane protein OmpA-like peptidoglycan-associated protein